MSTQNEGTPLRILETRDAIAIIVGLIIGSGIFKLPALVANFSGGSETAFYLMWVIGGLVSLVGALCYAELATAYPNTGGDYYFLQRAYGRNLSFLFAWARLAVVTSGSIAILAFVFGEYASLVINLGPYSTTIWAVVSILVFTGINLAGIRETTGTQNLLTSVEVLGVVIVIVTGLVLVGLFGPGAAPAAAAPAASSDASILAGLPLAILFVLFTFGGWNDGAYISAELKNQRSMVTALVASIIAVTILYLLVNWAYVNTLGLAGVAKSGTPAAAVMERVFGGGGATFISVIVAISALTSINATVIVGGRSNFALGRDWPIFGWLGHWDAKRDNPRNALIAQAVIALVLVFGSTAIGGAFQKLVEYTMPVFWFFVLLVGFAIFVLRSKEPNVARPFRVPLYPITPIIFIATCAYLLYRSVVYVKGGAWYGIGVMVIGVVLMLASRAMEGKRANA